MLFITQLNPTVLLRNVVDNEMAQSLIKSVYGTHISELYQIFSGYPKFLHHAHIQGVNRPFFLDNHIIDNKVHLEDVSLQGLLVKLKEYNNGNFYVVGNLSYYNEKYFIYFHGVNDTIIGQAGTTFFRKLIIKEFLTDL